MHVRLIAGVENATYFALATKILWEFSPGNTLRNKIY